MLTVFAILPRVLQLVQLDSKKQQLLTAESVALPETVIHQGLLADSAGLQQALAQLIPKAKQSPQQVVLMIPEDAVISHSLDLPKMPKKEIHEAVWWEAERYLPFAKNQAVLDWKSLPSKNGNHVLFQAATKELIDRFITVMESFQLELVAIETPALALVRLAEQKPGVRLLAHIAVTEAIITLSRDQEVVATSVVPQSSQFAQSITRTMADMMRYYQSFPVEWIQLGGPAVTNEVISTVKTLALPVAGFALPFKIDPVIANHYLLSLSAGSKLLVPPEDERTINLLPSWYVTQQSSIRLTQFLSHLGVVVLVVSSVLFVAVLGVYGYLWQQQQTLIQQVESVPAPQQDMITQTNAANTLAKLAIALDKDDFMPIGVIKAIEAQADDSIRLGKIQFNLREKRMEILGIADNRTRLLAFKHALEELEFIARVQVPVSSFSQEQEVPIQIIVQLNDSYRTLDKPAQL